MKNKEYEPIKVDETYKLIMRYYKAETDLQGIIVFVHGVSHGAWCWENFVDYFTKIGYACFAINLRGHGENDEKDIKGAKLQDYITDVIRCIDYIKNNHNSPQISIPYSKPFIVGHSMGGAIVELYISHYSDEVAGAILLAPVTANGMGTPSAFNTTFSKTGRNTVPTTMFGKPNKNLSCSNFFVAKTDNKNFIPRITDENELKYYDEQLCRESLSAMSGLIKYKLNKTDIPVLVIGSDKDAYFPKDSLEKTSQFYDTKPMILRGLCHDIMLDKNWEDAAWCILQFINTPEEFKKCCDEFIEKWENTLYPKNTQ